MSVNTSSSQTGPVRFAPDLQASIEVLARETSRSSSQVVEDAVREYIRRNEWERQLLAESDAGWDHIQTVGAEGSLTLEELTPWLESLGTNAELSPPFSIAAGK